MQTSADVLGGRTAHLVEVVQKLSLARDLDTVTAIVRRAARELSGSDGATFVLRDRDKCFYADEDAIAPARSVGSPRRSPRTMACSSTTPRGDT